jgi:hypothetical protein
MGALHSFGAAAKEHPELLWNSTAYFLDMAIADNALFDIESFDDLQEMEIPAGEEAVILKFKQSALDQPILRKCTKDNGIEEGMMPKSAFLSNILSSNANGRLFLWKLDSRREAGYRQEDRR